MRLFGLLRSEPAWQTDPCRATASVPLGVALRLRYDRLLERLEASLQSRAPLPRGLSLENSGVPVGFLQALDDYADPREWIDLAVVKPHRRENAASRGLLYSIGVGLAVG